MSGGIKPQPKVKKTRISHNLVEGRFGRWLVISKAAKNSNGSRWLCVCDCGTEREVNQGALLRGDTISCGCYAREESTKRLLKHGGSYTNMYRIWDSMKRRCNNPKSRDYERYGKRGISVCERWDNSFEAFYNDMGGKPFPEAQIDRIDNNGDYTPENCKWSTCSENSRNRCNSVKLTFRDETRLLIEWSEILSIPRNILSARIKTYGWSVERALTEKPKANKNRRLL